MPVPYGCPSRAQTLLSWPEEARFLRWFGLGRARRALDMGCGPGYVASCLLQDFPQLQIVGLDADGDLLRLASREVDAWPGRARFVEGRVEACPLCNGSVDFVLARYLFQHLADPVSAAREARRVLTQGGKLVVVDIDAALWGITEPALPEVGPHATDVAGASAHNRGDRRVGRRLWKILTAAGFDDVQLDAFVYHSDARGVAAFAPQLEPKLLLPLVKSGEIHAEQFDEVRQAYERFLQTPDAFVLMVGLIASGTRPRVQSAAGD